MEENELLEKQLNALVILQQRLCQICQNLPKCPFPAKFLKTMEKKRKDAGNDTIKLLNLVVSFIRYTREEELMFSLFGLEEKVKKIHNTWVKEFNYLQPSKHGYASAITETALERRKLNDDVGKSR